MSPRPTGSPLSGLCLPGHRGTTTNTTNTVTELSPITEPDDRTHLLHCWSWMCLRELLHGRDSFSMSACVALYIWSYNLICLIVDFLQSDSYFFHPFPSFYWHIQSFTEDRLMTRGDILVLDARESQEWQTSIYCYIMWACLSQMCSDFSVATI